MWEASRHSGVAKKHIALWVKWPLFSNAKQYIDVSFKDEIRV